MAERNTAFKENLALLRCPLCGADMYCAASSLKCTRGHDFTFNRKGCCDFAPQKHTALYTKELFESRRRVLRSRLYENAVRTLGALITRYAPEGPVLDAGCGEGSFLLGVREEGRAYFGADLSREGIHLAAAGTSGIGWAVADLARLPFQEGTLSAILNILSPAAYPEFKRVLKSDGVLIKAVPGDRYLDEIRLLTGKPPHSNEKVISLFDSQFERVHTEETEAVFALTEAEAEDLIRMTPLTEHAVSAEELKGSLTHITIHLCFLVGRSR